MRVRSFDSINFPYASQHETDKKKIKPFYELENKVYYFMSILSFYINTIFLSTEISPPCLLYYFRTKKSIT